MKIGYRRVSHPTSQDSWERQKEEIKQFHEDIEIVGDFDCLVIPGAEEDFLENRQEGQVLIDRIEGDVDTIVVTKRRILTRDDDFEERIEEITGQEVTVKETPSLPLDDSDIEAMSEEQMKTTVDILLKEIER